jgi:hypothetical protein
MVFWTDEQKVSARGAISYFRTFFIDEPAFLNKLHLMTLPYVGLRGDFFEIGERVLFWDILLI